MSASYRWTFRTLAAAALVAVASSASSAQVILPKANPNPGGVQPKAAQPKNPFAPQPLPTADGRKPSAFVMPSINTMPGIPVVPLRSAVVQPPFWNPAIQNPWMNQLTITPMPINPWQNPFVVNPVVQNPLVVNPLVQNPFRDPFALNPFFNNPLVLNPLLYNSPFNNPLNMPGLINRFGPTYPNYPTTTSQVSSTPPVAVQQPGWFLYKGPDLQVNPTSGTVYRPLSGTVTLADGSTFYRVPGSGLPTATGSYASGSGLYYNPVAGTFFNPSSGTLSKPGQTNVFLPYIW
jgi:hypothetical protein